MPLSLSPLKARLKPTWDVVHNAASSYARDNVSLMGAGVAFWAVLSLSPMLVIILVVTSVAYDAATVREHVMAWLNLNVGGRAADWIIGLLESASAPGATTLPGLVSLVVVAWSASRMFHALQMALNQIWAVRIKPRRGLGPMVIRVVRKRALTFLLLLTLVLLILLSLGASTTLRVLGRMFSDIPGWLYLYKALEVGISSVGIFVVVGLVYWILPDARIPFRFVWRGALATGLLLIGFKVVLGWYLGRSGLGTYGAAGSIVAVLLWIYLSTQVFFFGAELTRAYARVVGWPREPEPYAERTNRLRKEDDEG